MYDRNSLKNEIWDDIKPVPVEKKTRPVLSGLIWKIAASFIMVCFAGYFISRVYQTSQKDKSFAVSQTYKELSVPKGRKMQITLTDGTIISLNGDTRLKYPLEFNGHTRVVYLSGEAHFKVAKNPSKPFIIHTDKTDTRVLGTVFNVKAYPGETATILTVEEGRVQFSLKADPMKQIILIANQQGIATGDQTLDHQQVYAGGYTAWKDGKLIFNNLSLNEIVPLLNRWYNVRVTIGNHKLMKERFTGTYQRTSLNAIGQDISQALHCQFKLDGQSLIFY